MSTNTVHTPFRKGDTLTLPKGTVVHSTNPSKRQYTLQRAQTITVFSSCSGWVVTDRVGERGAVYLPTLTWPGTGGYWCDVQVTPELCAAVGVIAPELPGQDGKLGYTELDVVPSYDDGYTNRWVA